MPIEALVADLLSDRELVINRGSDHGVRVGMDFKILDPTSSVVTDPETGEVLGEVELTKVEVRVVSVKPRLSVCSTFKKVKVPGRPARGALSSYSSLSASIFGDAGTPDSVRFQTLRSSEPFARQPLDAAESYIARGDRAVQIVDVEGVR